MRETGSLGRTGKPPSATGSRSRHSEEEKGWYPRISVDEVTQFNRTSALGAEEPSLASTEDTPQQPTVQETGARRSAVCHDTLGPHADLDTGRRFGTSDFSAEVVSVYTLF